MVINKAEKTIRIPTIDQNFRSQNLRYQGQKKFFFLKKIQSLDHKQGGLNLQREDKNLITTKKHKHPIEISE